MLSVLASLVIVILELSANEKSTRLATASDVALSLSDWYTNVGLARVGGTLFRRAMKYPTSLSEDEQADFVYGVTRRHAVVSECFCVGTIRYIGQLSANGHA